MYKIAAPLLLSLAAPVAASFASMQGATTNLAFAEEKEKPESRTVGVYLVNVGKTDLQAGSYDIDFYIWFQSNDPNANFTKAPRALTL